MLTDPNQFTEPIWSDALRPVPSATWPGDRLQADVVVIGSGFAGLSAAYHLLAASPGAKVVVLEAERIGYGASSRNTGMLTPGVGQNLGGLVRRFGPDTARAMYECSLRAVQYVEELTTREGIDASLKMTGQLVVAQGRSGRRRLASQAALMECLSLPCEKLDDSGLQQRLRISNDAPGGEHAGPAALRLPVAGVLHPGRVVQGLSDAILRRGGQIVEGARVVSLSRGEPVVATLDDGREVVARRVVLASNGYDKTLGLQRGRILPLHLRLLLTEPLSPEKLAALSWHGREGVIDSRRVFNYFRLTDDNRLLFGGGLPRYRWGGSTADLGEDRAAIAALAAMFRQFFPALHDLPVARSWTGVIAYTLDTLPVVGYLPGYRGVIFVGGWCGHGVALSLTSGQWVQQLIDSGHTTESFPWFRPRAPLVPTDLARWTGIRLGSWATEMLDRL